MPVSATPRDRSSSAPRWPLSPRLLSDEHLSCRVVLGRIRSHPPLGATVGDLLDSLWIMEDSALSRPIASAVIASLMIFCIMLLPHMGTAKREPV